MGYLKERVSYLKGLAEGMQIGETTNEGKLLKAMLEVLDDVVLTVEDIEEVQDSLSDQVDEIDEDLSEIENAVYEDDECDCGHDHDHEDDDLCFAEIECPHCHETINIDADMIDEDDESITCPNCHKSIEIEWDCGCDDCKEEETED